MLQDLRRRSNLLKLFSCCHAPGEVVSIRGGFQTFGELCNKKGEKGTATMTLWL